MMADKARDPESLEREIEQTRDELARTIDALAYRVSPKHVAERGVSRIKEEAGQVAATVAAFVQPPDPEDHGAIARRNTAIVIGAGVVLGLTALAVLRGRRKRRR
jgi:hypothetical protein